MEIDNTAHAAHKVCARCKQEKTTECFGKNKATKDGLSAYCKECGAARQREHYQRAKQRNAEGGGKHTVHTLPELASITNRQLLAELKARGYVWADMKVITQVPYDKI